MKSKVVLTVEDYDKLKQNDVQRQDTIGYLNELREQVCILKKELEDMRYRLKDILQK